MIVINIPRHFVPERTYALDVLLGNILGLDYRIEIVNRPHYEFNVGNGKKLIIEDRFFSGTDEEFGYLRENNLPGSVRFVKNRFIKGEDIPVIYGTGALEVNGDNSRMLCGIDIIASAFFMLTRWEEYVLSDRDEHDRFPAAASLAFRCNFLDRPVVNEYAGMLWQMLQYLGCRQKTGATPFHFVLTHDVDALLKWLDWKHVLHTAAGDIVKRRQPKTALSRITEYRKIRRQEIKDPFDTFDWLMDLSESLQLKSHFYFMSTARSPSPNDRHSPYPLNHPRTRAIFQKIKTRGHITGFHPGYETINDEAAWASQREQLEKASEASVNCGRQHYLRFQVPYTWQLWENQGMETDSTCGYADREGFRCGTGHRFPVFNILTRKKLKLHEQPLIFMDVCNFHDGGCKGKSFNHHHLFDIISTARTFNTPVTLLFHNNVFEEPGFTGFYKEILS
jgi:hypothetical protein